MEKMLTRVLEDIDFNLKGAIKEGLANEEHNQETAKEALAMIKKGHKPSCGIDLKRAENDLIHTCTFILKAEGKNKTYDVQ